MKPRPTVNEKNKYCDESVTLSQSVKQSIYDTKKIMNQKRSKLNFLILILPHFTLNIKRHILL